MYFQGVFLYHIAIDAKCIRKEIMGAVFACMYILFMVCLSIWGKYYREPQDMLKQYDSKKLSDYSMEEKIAYNKAYDKLRRKCKELSDNGEVTYFSMEDIDSIISQLKKEE